LGVFNNTVNGVIVFVDLNTPILKDWVNIDIRIAQLLTAGDMKQTKNHKRVFIPFIK
tara:strand:- start:963 stop:1133 length:171 start_codon:yes stop_codon:yes gene_type:complete